MLKNIILYIFLIVILLFSFAAKAQSLADEVAAFKKADSANHSFKDKQPIVFAGSSSFRKWQSIEKDFDDYPILNRGFGGSTLPDLIFYVDDLILKYDPKQIIIYCGDNDLAKSDTITSTIVFERFKKLFFIIRKQLPGTAIAFVSIKPSPSREKIIPRIKETNKLVRKFLKKQKNTSYIDVYSAMINDDDTIKNELFIEDNLHLNEKGYAIWKKIIKPYLLKST